MKSGIIISDFKLHYRAIAKKCMVLAQKQTQKSMEQNRRPMQLYPPDFWQRHPKCMMAEKASSTNVA
jgi:hypothetical protein